MSLSKEKEVDNILEEAIGKKNGITWKDVQEIYADFTGMCQRSGLTPREELIVQLASPY